MQLTGATNHIAAWRAFVRIGDVVGIKVNPVGNPAILSAPPIYLEIIDGLLAAGIKRRNIIVFERFRTNLNNIRSYFPADIRVESTSESWEEVQQDMGGYDPAYYVDFGTVQPGQNPLSPAARRSYAAKFITTGVTKLINVANMKTHGASGVTLSLKNLSHGLVNNVNRSHGAADLLWVRDFIPAVVRMNIIRSKVVLNFVDGTNGMYHTGPYGDSRYVWPHKTLYASTDAVALDRVVWKALDEKRLAMGFPRIAEAPADPAIAWDWRLRQPEHILYAGIAGLGVYRDEQIQFTKQTIG